MVIEHVFVTTLESQDAMQAATAFLAARGFASAMPAAFHLAQPDWTSLEMSRGKRSVRKRRGLLDQPQSVRLEFDRGRITIAAAIEITGRSFWTGVGRELSPDSPKAQRPIALLMTIVRGLEQLLAHRQSPEAAGAEWLALEGQLAEEQKRLQRRSRWFLLIAIIFALAAIGLVVAAVLNAKR